MKSRNDIFRTEQLYEIYIYFIRPDRDFPIPYNGHIYYKNFPRQYMVMFISSKGMGRKSMIHCQ